ncbi:MAG: PhnD/SsuA/transferrin family substrate-binding protein [Myxococcales bacterium]|nr:PhnD/SsuA/transferrin family substrate-binding protein [Myxococcales bacterium]
MKAMLLLAGLLLALPAAAQPEAPAGYVVGVFAPRIYFPNSLARTGYANDVAAKLTAATGIPFSGRGFATRGDFDRQVQEGQVHFAVVEAQLQAERGFTALAQGTSGGNASRPMVLVTSDGATPGIGALKGRTLALVAVGGRDKSFVMNHLLQGQVPADWFKTTTARDAQGALSLVKLGKADAAFTFSGNADGLGVSFQSRGAPLPVFVQTARDLDAAVVAKVRGAITGVSARNGVFDGFGAFDGASLGRLKRDLDAGPRAPGNDPAFAGPRSALPPVPDQMERGAVALPAPDPAALMAIPAPPADAF